MFGRDPQPRHPRPPPPLPPFGAPSPSFLHTRLLAARAQDYPKALPPSASVGFTCCDAEACFSPCKNAPDAAATAQRGGKPPACAASAEAETYGLGAALLRAAGCEVARAAPKAYGGVTVALGPAVVLDPSFALTLSDVRAALRAPRAVKLSARASLVVRGSAVEIGTLDLDGALELDASAPGAKIVVVSLSVKNQGIIFEPLGTDALAAASEEVRMRGFTTRALEVRKVVANAGVTITIDGEKLVASPTELSNRPGFEICSCFA